MSATRRISPLLPLLPYSSSSRPRPYSTRAERAHGIRHPYHPHVRHKRTLLPLHRDLLRPPSTQTGVPWVDASNQRYHDTRHATQHPVPRKGTPSRHPQSALYAYCLRVCEARYPLLRTTTLTTTPLHPTSNGTKSSHRPDTPTPTTPSSSSDPLRNPPSPTPPAHYTPLTYRTYQALTCRTLRDPPLGPLTLLGSSRVQEFLHETFLGHFPRLRAPHLEALTAAVCGLTPVVGCAGRLGMARVLGLATEVGLWRELQVLQLRRARLRQALGRAQDKVLSGNVGERIFHYRRALGAATRQLRRRSPAQLPDLLPRVRWLCNHVWAWVGYVYLIRGEVFARALVRKLMFPVARKGGKDGRHPLERKREVARRAERSAGGMPSTRLFTSSKMVKRKARFPDVPDVLVEIVDPPNALKEIQFIVKYSGLAPASIEGQPISFRPAYVTADDDPPQDYTTEQQPQREKLMATELLFGEHVLGIGEGYDLQESMQEAAIHAVHNFYFASPENPLKAETASEAST